jgi:hypothetical protein
MITLESLCAAVLALLALIGFNIATGVAIELLPDGLVGPDARLPIEAGLVVAGVVFWADRGHAPPAAMLVSRAASVSVTATRRPLRTRSEPPPARDRPSRRSCIRGDAAATPSLPRSVSVPAPDGTLSDDDGRGWLRTGDLSRVRQEGPSGDPLLRTPHGRAAPERRRTSPP